MVDTILYERLGLNAKASSDDINSAFKKLAREYHPDKAPAEKKDEYTKKFQDILQAKEVLMDKEKRNIYDQVGMDMFKNNMDQQQPDMSSFFGNFNPFGGHGHVHEEREDIEKKLDVTLEQIYNEETVTVNYRFKSMCIKCTGEGTSDGKSSICTNCNGRGMQVRVMQMGPMIQQVQMACGPCKGKGKVVQDNNKCDGCAGKCFNYKDKSLQVPLKSGLTSGNKIQLSGKGHQLKNAKTDLILIINELPHQVFTRYNNNLIMNIELKLYQALFGFEKCIEHLDKEKFIISSNTKTDYNKVVKINNKGMKSMNGKSNGDLYVRFTINIPNLNNMDNDTKHKYKTLFKSFDSSEANLEANLNKSCTKCSFVECKEKESSMVHSLLFQSQKEETHEERSNQCVHQ